MGNCIVVGYVVLFMQLTHMMHTLFLKISTWPLLDNPTFQVSDNVGNKRTQHNTSNFISIDVMYIMSDEITNTADVIIMLNK